MSTEENLNPHQFGEAKIDLNVWGDGNGALERLKSARLSGKPHVVPAHVVAKQDYASYIHGEYDHAENALGGSTGITPEGARRGVTLDDYFHPDATRRKRSMKYATRELRAHFGHEDTAVSSTARGFPMSFTQYRRQSRTSE